MAEQSKSSGRPYSWLWPQIPFVEHPGPTSLWLCFSLEEGPVEHVFVNTPGRQLDKAEIHKTFRILLNALPKFGYDAEGRGWPPAMLDPQVIIRELRLFLSLSRPHSHPLPRYCLLGFEPPKDVDFTTFLGFGEKDFVNACQMALRQLTNAPYHDHAVSGFLNPDTAVLAFLTNERPSWESVSVKELKKDIPSLDDPNSTLPPLPPEVKRPRGRPAKPRVLQLKDVERGTTQLNELLRPHSQAIVAFFQSYLDQLAGKACPSFPQNRKVVEHVVSTADGHGITLLCSDERPDGDKQLHPVRLHCEESPPSGKFTARLGDKNATPIYYSPMFPTLTATLGQYDPSAKNQPDSASSS